MQEGEVQMLQESKSCRGEWSLNDILLDLPLVKCDNTAGIYVI